MCYNFFTGNLQLFVDNAEKYTLVDLILQCFPTKLMYHSYDTISTTVVINKHKCNCLVVAACICNCLQRQL